MSRLRDRVYQCERGNASLYVMLIVPFAVMLSAATVDISRWNGARSSLQLEADRLALIAASMLPARNGVETYLQHNLDSSVGEDRSMVSVSWPDFDSSSVTVTISAELSPGLIGTVLGKQRLTRSATAALVPVDYAVVIADGATLRPGITLNGAATTIAPSWGDINQWPSSGYFHCVLPPSPAVGPYDWSWWNSWAEQSFQRWLTQGCYNPIWSAVKAAAISLIDNAASDSRSRISLYFTPGNSQFERFHRVRSIFGFQDDTEIYSGQRGGFLRDTQSSAQAEFSDYVELEQLSSDELCLLMADPLSAVNDRYEISDNIFPNPASQSCSGGALESFCGSRHVPYGRVDSCYKTNQWTLRESIYYRQARLRTPEFDAEPDIESSIVAAFSELIDERSVSALSRAQTFRGNLFSTARRRIIVLTDRLPRIGQGAAELRERLREISRLGVEVQLVAVAHEYLTAEERIALTNSVDQLSELEESNVDVALVNDIDKLGTEIVPSILLKNRQISLVR